MPKELAGDLVSANQRKNRGETDADECRSSCHCSTWSFISTTPGRWRSRRAENGSMISSCAYDPVLADVMLIHRRIMSRVAYATSLFDQDGIQVRFMNNRIEGNNIASEPAALQLVQQVKFSGESDNLTGALHI